MRYAKFRIVTLVVLLGLLLVGCGPKKPSLQEVLNEAGYDLSSCSIASPADDYALVSCKSSVCPSSVTVDVYKFDEAFEAGGEFRNKLAESLGLGDTRQPLPE